MKKLKNLNNSDIRKMKGTDEIIITFQDFKNMENTIIRLTNELNEQKRINRNLLNGNNREQLRMIRLER